MIYNEKQRKGVRPTHLTQAFLKDDFIDINPLNNAILIMHTYPAFHNGTIPSRTGLTLS